MAHAPPRYPDLRARRRLPELMDAPDLDNDRHVHALQALARVNRLSRSAARVWKQIRRLAADGGEPLRILDVACGGGDVAIDIQRLAARRRVRLRVDGCDSSPTAVAHARRQAASGNVEVRFFELDVIDCAIPEGYDVICSSLFLHHLDDDTAVETLRRMGAVARRLIFVQDLVRSHAGYLLAWAGTRLLSSSDVARIDGPRSVQAAFTLEEAIALTRRAGLAGAGIERCWPQRFMISWEWR